MMRVPLDEGDFGPVEEESSDDGVPRIREPSGWTTLRPSKSPSVDVGDSLRVGRRDGWMGDGRKDDNWRRLRKWDDIGTSSPLRTPPRSREDPFATPQELVDDLPDVERRSVVEKVRAAAEEWDRGRNEELLDVGVRDVVEKREEGVHAMLEEHVEMLQERLATTISALEESQERVERSRRALESRSSALEAAKEAAEEEMSLRQAAESRIGALEREVSSLRARLERTANSSARAAEAETRAELSAREADRARSELQATLATLRTEREEHHRANQIWMADLNHKDELIRRLQTSQYESSTTPEKSSPHKDQSQLIATLQERLALLENDNKSLRQRLANPTTSPSSSSSSVPSEEVTKLVTKLSKSLQSWSEKAPRALQRLVDLGTRAMRKEPFGMDDLLHDDDDEEEHDDKRPDSVPIETTYEQPLPESLPPSIALLPLSKEHAMTVANPDTADAALERFLETIRTTRVSLLDTAADNTGEECSIQ